MNESVSIDNRLVVIGAGPAGLTAAYSLSQHGMHPVVLEQDSQVGGLCKTMYYKGYGFDLGGHRFFTKHATIQKLWEELLPTDFEIHSRLSRIHYNGNFFQYPLRPLQILPALGLIESCRILGSYVRSRIAPFPQDGSFENWVSNQFGKRLYSLFFKSYTEKVWGIPCSQLSGAWAQQRIKNLNLSEAVVNGFLKRRKPSQKVVTSLIEQFHYPRLGPGMMWEACKQAIQRNQGDIFLNAKVTQIAHKDGKITHVTYSQAGKDAALPVSTLYSSMPLRDFIYALKPSPPPDIVRAADSLRYRDFLLIFLILNKSELFPDNWIYIHDPEVRMGRIQNFKNWSAALAPHEGVTSLGLEYFVQKNDTLWNMNNQELIQFGIKECEQLGLFDAGLFVDGTVARVANAYPVYTIGYENHLMQIREWISSIKNLHLIGRNGLHRYNNMDHSMLTALAAVSCTFGEQVDVWSLDPETYIEEIRIGDGAARID